MSIFTLQLWSISSTDQSSSKWSDDFFEIIQIYTWIILPWLIVCLSLVLFFGFEFVGSAGDMNQREKIKDHLLPTVVCSGSIHNRFTGKGGINYSTYLNSSRETFKVEEVCNVQLF